MSLALLDGQLHKSSPRALPEPLQQDSKLVNRWLQLTQHEQSEEEIPNSPVGNILYVAEPIEIGGKIRGVFIVAHTTAGEHGEVFEAVRDEGTGGVGAT